MTIINVKAWFELTSFIENNSVYFSNEELGKIEYPFSLATNQI